MALVLGNEPDADSYRNTRKILKENFNKIYWNGNEYRSPLLTVTDDRANGLAVVAGLADEAKWPLIRKVLESKFYASPYMEKYILESCFRMNMPDFGIKRMKNRYQKMVESPITSLWEGWDINNPEFGGGTYNHGWTGGPLTLMAEYIAGIAPDQPGYAEYHILPQLGGLSSVNCRTYTVRGMIDVVISSSSKQFTLKTEGPTKTPVTIGVPSGNYETISINKIIVWNKGKSLENNLVSFEGNDNGFIRFKSKSLSKIELKAILLK
jgi:hypothetical protein